MKAIPGLFSIMVGLALLLNGCGPAPTAAPTQPAATQPAAATSTGLPTPTTKPVPAGKTLTVTSAADSGLGSLRWTLQDARPGDTITFDPAMFPPGKPAVIKLSSPFEGLTQGKLTIDATNAGVILDGSQAGGVFKSGIEIQSDDNVVKGLHVIGFNGAGIAISGGRRNLIEGNITGGNEEGIGLWGTSALNNRITGNYVGVLPDGVTAEPNLANGIIVMEGAHGNQIGPGNVLAFNRQLGVEIISNRTNQNRIFENSIHDNAAGGIGLTEGGNDNVAAPRLMEADLGAGRLDGTACPKCEVLIYSDGKDQGGQYEGSTDADERGTFEFQKGIPFAGPALTATVIDADGNTSAFSVPFRGSAHSLQVQSGNTQPRLPVANLPSDDLEDNGIGGLWSPRQAGFSDTIEYEIVPLGLKHVRIQFNEGEYTSTGGGARAIDWSRPEMPVPPDMQGVVPQLVSHNIIIDYVLIFWDKANHPQGWQVKPRFKTEEEISRYLDYVRFTVSNFKGKVQYYELWNEPDLEEPLQYIEPADYIKLAERAIPLIHEIDPAAKVSVGAVAGTANATARAYLFKILNSDVMRLADVVSWHPFYDNAPNGGKFPAYYAGYPALLDEIKNTAAQHGFKGQYIADEITFSGPGCGGCDVNQPPFSDIVSAKYTARVVLLHRGSGVLTGVGGISSARTIHYGTLQNLTNVLAGATPEPIDVQVDTAVRDFKVVTFTRTDGSRLVTIWNDGPATDDDPGSPSTVTIAGYAGWGASAIDILNGFEQDLTASRDGENLVINDFLLKDYPLIIRLSK